MSLCCPHLSLVAQMAVTEEGHPGSSALTVTVGGGPGVQMDGSLATLRRGTGRNPYGSTSHPGTGPGQIHSATPRWTQSPGAGSLRSPALGCWVWGDGPALGGFPFTSVWQFLVLSNRGLGPSSVVP